VASALAGFGLTDCATDLAMCVGDLDTCNGTVTTLSGNLSTCNDSLGTCNGTLGTCEADLATCQAGSPTPTATPAATATPTPVCTPSSSGTFTDNCDGTVSDSATGLMWEKKTSTVGCGPNFADPHDVDNTYTWCLDANVDHVCDNTQSTAGPQDGPVFTQFLAALNTPPCFAGHCDWRLPKSGGRPDRPDLGGSSGEPAELESILLAPNPCGTSPCIDPIFGPTVAGKYWSAVTFAPNTPYAWSVNFTNGYVDGFSKHANGYVRAVRSILGD
jgi:hypothetical protein